MKKEDVELCREIIKVFDKANFSLPAPEMVELSIKIMNFAKMVQRMEQEVAKPIAPAPVEVANAPKKPRVRKENPIKVE